MNLKFRVSQSAFTLVETLIYIAIIGGAVTAFVNFSISVSNSRNKTYVVQEVQANARTALDIVGQNIRGATGVNTASSTFGSNPGALYLTMASTTLNPTIFDINDGVLQMTESTSSPVVTSIVSDEVRITNLIFTNLTGSSTRENIRVEMTMEYNNPSGAKEFEYEQSVQTAVSVRQ
jgi:type II secretory pathway pseudopilin PulG